MRNKKGFTMVELLVVLVIVAILAAVATPIYLANVQRARASEAVSAMALIRQAERDFQINRNTYFDVIQETTVGNIQNPLPLSADATTAEPNPSNAGADVDATTTQYFSNQSYWVVAGTGLPANGAFGATSTWSKSSPPNPVDFLVAVDGGDSVQCLADGSNEGNCAVKGDEVDGYLLEMDNSGRMFVSYDNGDAWSQY